MTLSTVLRPVMKTTRGLDASTRILAALARHPVDTHVVRKWLISNGPADVAALASSFFSWRALRTLAAKHRAETSSGAALRRVYQLAATQVLRPFSRDNESPSRVLKTRAVAALALHDIYADSRGWDSWLANRGDIACTFGISKPAATTMLRYAKDFDVLNERARASNGARRFAFKPKPKGYEPTAIEIAMSASLDARTPDVVAQWVMSVGHPAWNHDDEFDLSSWWAVVRFVSGDVPRGKADKQVLSHFAALSGDPSGLTWDTSMLGQRTDAIGRAAEARRLRAEESAERSENVAAFKALEAEAKRIFYDDLTWPPTAGLGAWSEATAEHLATNPPTAEVGPLLWKLIKTRISKKYPADLAARALGIIAGQPTEHEQEEAS